MLEVLVVISQKFCCKKETGGYAKVIHKKKRKMRKNRQVSDIFKTMGTLMLAWKKKKKMNKIAHIFLQSCFQVSNERCVFKEHSRIRLATIYPYTCTSWFDCMTQLSLDLGFDFTIYALQACSSLLPTYELHISFSCRKRKAYYLYCLGEDPQISHILRDLRVSYNGISEFYFKNL